jgi:shikimate dehydrogenase
MASRGAAVLKIVASPTSVAELPELRRFLAEVGSEGPATACFAIGREGATSRLLAPSWGSWATYGALETDRRTAPGQIAVHEMIETFDVLSIGKATRLFALVGARVAESPSPAMHAAAYRARSIDARYLPVETDDFEGFAKLVDPRGGFGLEAFAVTIPFKAAAADRCEAGDPLAAACGAVNTVLAAGERWRGYNTDGVGALERLRVRLDPRGRRVAVLGAGGTGRAVTAALSAAGAVVTLFNRDPSRGREAANRLGVRFAPWNELAGFDWEVLVNATPLGKDGARFLPASTLGGRVVIDAVYAPRPTSLVRDALGRGLEAIDGLEFLAAQAVPQFRLMTGAETDFELLHEAARSWMATRVA